MVRQPAALRALIAWSGVIVTLVSATLLAFVLWQANRLDTLGGLDPSSLDKYRLALNAGADIIATEEAIADYRNAIVLGATPMETRARRDVITARMASLDVLFGRNGTASAFDSGSDWPASEKTWNKILGSAPGLDVVPLFKDLTDHFENLLANAENNSGLNYDANKPTQDLGGVI